MSVKLQRQILQPFASSARSAGTSQASSEIVVDAFTEISMLVDLTAIFGTPTTTTLDVKIQYSPDTSGSRWIDLPDGAITQLTAVGRQVINRATLFTARRVRVVYTLAFTGGTSPTATFAVDVALMSISASREIQKVTLSDLLASENLFDGVFGTLPKYVVSSLYSGTSFSNFGTATNANVRAAAGMLKSFMATNASATVCYFQIFNLAAAPTEDVSVPIFSFAIPAGTANNPGICEKGEEFFGIDGYYLSAGVSWGISATKGVFDAAGLTASNHLVGGIII